MKEHDRRHDQRERAEQTEDRVEEHVRPAGEQVRIGERESDHPVGHVGQAIRAGQRSGEQLDQAPGHQDPHHIAGHQHAGRLDQRAPADLGPELPIGQHQQDDRDDVQGEPEILAQDLGGGVVPGGDIGGVQAGGENHVAQQQQPGDPLARGQGRGQQGQHERPRDAGVGKLNR